MDYVLSHGSSPTKEDVEAMTIPHICLAAPTDNKNGGIDAYKEAFSKEGRIGEVETYPTMFHGWMGGRAKLEDAENAKEFERGQVHKPSFRTVKHANQRFLSYNQVATFFAKHF